jgi:hypothetical protein
MFIFVACLAYGHFHAMMRRGDQILGRVIAESASRLNVMDLKIFHFPARVATPSILASGFSGSRR